MNKIFVCCMFIMSMYLRVSQVSPKKPASHPVKQEPLILEHCSNSAQWPHVLLQAVPKYPLSQAKINGFRLSFIKICLNSHKTFYFSSLEKYMSIGWTNGRMHCWWIFMVQAKFEIDKRLGFFYFKRNIISYFSLLIYKFSYFKYCISVAVLIMYTDTFWSKVLRFISNISFQS